MDMSCGGAAGRRAATVTAMTDDARPRSLLRRWVVPLALLCAPWAIYLAVVSQQPVDGLGAWRNDIFWPAEHYLTVGLGGLLVPFLLYLGCSLFGGMLLGAALLLLAAGVRRVLALADVSAWAGPAAMIAAPIFMFTFKVVPLVVTEVEPEARRLVVREFHWLLRYPTGELEIAAAEIEALDLSLHFHRGSGHDLIMFALTQRGAVRLGQRMCGGSDVETCLREGDAEMVELARLLGSTGGTPEAGGRDGHRTLRLDP
jgi:hypothetical protein